MEKPLLEIKNLTKHFPVKTPLFSREKKFVHAVTEVTLELRKGEVLGLVGESGCGKSTLGRTILKLHDLDQGQIVFQGHDLTSLTSKGMQPFRRDMQMIFQDPFSSLNPRMTIGSILSEPLLVHRVVPRHKRHHRVLELLDLVGLTIDAVEKYPHEFSGGQRQRIGIARALAVEPKLIIADEPVSALDISIQAQIINLLMDLKKRLGLTMIFIAHDLNVVEHISDRICVMYLGRVMEIFPGGDLEKKARHPYTKSLLEAIPIPDPLRKRKREILSGEIPSPMHPPSGCVFRTRCPLAQESCAKQIPTLRKISEDHFLACDVVEV